MDIWGSPHSRCSCLPPVPCRPTSRLYIHGILSVVRLWDGQYTFCEKYLLAGRPSPLFTVPVVRRCNSIDFCEKQPHCSAQ